MNLAQMRRHGPRDVVDAIVIGTGAGGAPLAYALAKAGCSVVALEAGRNHNPKDFTADEITQASDLNWMGERLSAGADPEAFGANNSGIGVGGSMLHWGAFAPRATDIDLRLATTTGKGCDWPLALSELLPYYAMLETYLGVSGPENYPWGSKRRYAMPPVARNAPAQLMARACAELGIRATDAPAAVLTKARVSQDAQLHREACVNCGLCHQGCRFGAKASMDTTFLADALPFGLEIRPESFVHGFRRTASGQIDQVIYRGPDGRDHLQQCRAVFLCAGAVETPRLLLHTQLCNQNGMVGRNYMAHVATQVWGTFSSETRPNKGYPSSLITEDFVRPAGAAFTGGYLVQSLGVQPLTFANQVVRGRGLWGEPLLRYLANFNHLAGIGINGECLPSEGNHLTLSEEKDSIGMPKAHVCFSYGENEKRLDAHAVSTMSSIWKAAGASDIWACPRAAHTIGTCRMGTNPDDSVVDPWGRTHEISNLWISDNSVFPSSLSANPALTIMALSLRAADKFLEN